MKKLTTTRGQKIVSLIIDGYKEVSGIFANRVNVEDSLPRKKLSGLEKALFVFYVVQLDYAMRSVILYEGARRLWEERPQFFDPQFLVEVGEKELRRTLSDYLHPRFVNEAVKRWKFNSKVLRRDFGGDPRRIFEGVDSAAVAMKGLKRFRGFGPKIGNLFFRVMINLSLAKTFADAEKVSPPVDTHDIRLAFDLGLLRGEPKSDHNTIQRVKEVWSEACREAGVSWFVLDKALWLLGSEGCAKRRCSECPVLEFCRRKI